MKFWMQCVCKRCREPFNYYRGRGRIRYYCPPCKTLEIKEANAFVSAMVSQQRREARHAQN